MKKIAQLLLSNSDNNLLLGISLGRNTKKIGWNKLSNIFHDKIEAFLKDRKVNKYGYVNGRKTFIEFGDFDLHIEREYQCIEDEKNDIPNYGEVITIRYVGVNLLFGRAETFDSKIIDVFKEMLVIFLKVVLLGSKEILNLSTKDLEKKLKGAQDKLPF